MLLHELSADGTSAVCFGADDFFEDTSPNTQKRNRPTAMKVTHANFASMLSGFESILPLFGIDSWLDFEPCSAGPNTALPFYCWTERVAP